MTTIRDVAQAAHVSIATVSRVLNNTAPIARETRERVLAAIKQLGFVPNVLARNFAVQSTCTVALLINIENARAYSNPFFSEVMHGIETVVYAEGYFLLIANEKTISNQKITLDQLMMEKRIDGLVLPSSLLKAKLLNRLAPNRFPFVIIGEPGQPSENLDFVDINNTLGGEQAVAHLVEQGYRRIAYIGGRKTEGFNRNRLAGYRNGLRRHGFPILEERILEEPDEISKDSGYRLARELLNSEEAPDAIVCTDNILAWGVLKAIKEQGFKVPEDIGLVSFDNFPLADFMEPTLTTVDIDVFALGAQSASILMKRIKMPDMPHQQSYISPKLIVRESSVRNTVNSVSSRGAG